jgi:hypothetical protein
MKSAANSRRQAGALDDLTNPHPRLFSQLGIEIGQRLIE